MRHSEGYRDAQRLRGETIASILGGAKPRRAGAVCVHVQSNGLNYPRLGLVVPKRFLPRAVDRNRAKRLIREWFRRNQALLGGRDLLVRVDTRSSRIEWLIQDVERALVLER